MFINFTNLLSNIKKNRKAIFLVIASIVVVITTYTLILPAFTLEKETADRLGGINVEAEYTQDTTPAEEVEEAKDAEDVKKEEKADDVKKPEKAEHPEKTEDSKDIQKPAEVKSPTQLKYQGNGYNVECSFDEKADIGDAELKVKELDDKAGRSYSDKAEKAVLAAEKQEGGNKKAVAFSAYDISLLDGKEEVEPETPASVSFEYKKLKKMNGADDVRVVHFAVENGTEKTEILDSDDVDADISKKGLKSLNFTADSFSVYVIVYTVDFEYDVDGKKYTYSMEGDGALSLRELVGILHIAEDPDSFMKEIKEVTFSNPDLLYVYKVEETKTLLEIKGEEKLFQQSDSYIKEKDIRERNAKKFEAGDWALISLAPFATKEELKVVLSDGSEFSVTVTDDQDDATMNDDGETVKTVPNPAGTWINLFDYWVDDDLHSQGKVARDAWPGYDSYSQHWNDPLHGTTGNNSGINSSTSDTAHGHAFKFSPAFGGMVYDGTYGNWQTPTSDGSGRVNSWTGNANPVQGLVENTLVDGYPKLHQNNNLGTTDESLAYLFDPEINPNGTGNKYQAGKEAYTGVNNLIYVDKDGYYKFDSWDFNAQFDKDSKQFTLTKQTSDDTEVRGFWPFGQQQFWVGMQLHSDFSMPANGKVLNPKGENLPMIFEFQGDDDVWVYIDGILIGDAGGVHNKTKIYIDFEAGTVRVTGKDDPVHTGDFDRTLYIDDLYRAAGKYDDYEWESIPGSSHKRFEAGSFHQFDMFYLERGGGESNLHIKYNLVSTMDFTAHKTYTGIAGDERMERNQFQFELVGFDGKYTIDNNSQLTPVAGAENTQAIMPANGTPDGAGTVEDPKKEHDDQNHLTSLIVGVTEDGNVNFGNVEQDSSTLHPGDTFKYMIREIVPDDAVNGDGKRWDQATDEEKAAGGFVKDSVTYDGRVYYYAGTVRFKDGRYDMKKTRYTDSTYTTVDTETKFFNFNNELNPNSGHVEFDKVDAEGQPLQNAEFTLYTDSACTKIAKDLNGNEQKNVRSGADGKVEFSNMRAPKTYYMKETKAPDGYEQNDTKYKVRIAEDGSPNSHSVITVIGDDDHEPIDKIYNIKDGELSVVKKWVDENGDTADPEGRTAKVKLKRYRYVPDGGAAPQSHNVTINFSGNDYNGRPFSESKTETVSGSDIKIEWRVSGGAGDGTFTPYDYKSWDAVTRESIYGIDYHNVTGNIVLNVVLNEYYPVGDRGFSIDSFEITGSDEPASLIIEPDPDFSDTQTLSSANNYAHKWTVGNGSGEDLPRSNNYGDYLYYAVEVKDDGTEVPIGGEMYESVTLKSITYTPSKVEDKGINTGLITITNEIVDEDISITLEKYIITDLDKPVASKLGGATFKIEKYINGDYQEIDSEWPAQTIADTGKTGVFNFEGIKKGYYMLTEVDCPEGYVKTVDHQKFKVTISGGNAVITLLDDNNQEISSGITDEIRLSNTTMKYGNTPGKELPHSGGPGTTMIYMLGTMLTMLGGVMLIARRRAAMNK